MENRISIYALIMSIVVLIFLIVEFTDPVSSLPLVIGAIVLSVAGFGCALKGVRNDRSPLSIITIIFSSIVMVAILFMFAIWLIMGA